MGLIGEPQKSYQVNYKNRISLKRTDLAGPDQWSLCVVIVITRGNSQRPAGSGTAAVVEKNGMWWIRANFGQVSRMKFNLMESR